MMKIEKLLYGKIAANPNYSKEGKRNALENRIMDLLFSILIPAIIIFFTLHFVEMINR